MKKGRSKSQFTFTRSISDTPMTREQWEATEDLLAKFVARAILHEMKEEKNKEG